MVIKILKNVTGFPGVAYSENKNEKGTGDLMLIKNFSGLDISKSSKQDYIDYLSLVGNLNPKVKNKQFHAVVSAKGKENTPEELKDAAEKYLKYMGYENNPYLIYQHNDTANNHVHIVSTRVDKKGKKIPDTFEKVRTQKFIKKELKIDHSKIYDKTNFLSYDFSNHRQFKLLFELQNYKVVDKKEHYVIYSGGTKKDTIQKKDIALIIENRKIDQKKISEIKAKFHKFKPGMTPDAFIAEMRKKFGYEIVLHYGKEATEEKRINFKKNIDPKIPEALHKKPYGYTIIDHKNKNIYKGSEVHSLSFVLNQLNEKEHKEILFKILTEALNEPKLSLYQLNGKLRAYDYSISYKGIVKSKAMDKELFAIEPSRAKELLYYNKVHLINQYYASDEFSATILQKFYRIRNEDYKVVPKLDLDKSLNYTQIIEQHFSNPQFSKKELEKQQLKVIHFRGNYFLVDLENKAIVPIPAEYNNSINPKITEDYNEKITPMEKSENLDKAFNQEIKYHESLYLIPGPFLSGGEDDDDDFVKRPKRKKRNINKNRKR